MGGPPKSILAISDLTLGGSTDRADVPIGNAQQSLLQQRDRWFESGSLQRRVHKPSVPPEISPRGTDGSNPVPSSGESGEIYARAWPRVPISPRAIPTSIRYP